MKAIISMLAVLFCAAIASTAHAIEPGGISTNLLSVKWNIGNKHIQQPHTFDYGGYFGITTKVIQQAWTEPRRLHADANNKLSRKQKIAITAGLILLTAIAFDEVQDAKQAKRERRKQLAKEQAIAEEPELIKETLPTGEATEEPESQFPPCLPEPLPCLPLPGQKQSPHYFTEPEFEPPLPPDGGIKPNFNHRAITEYKSEADFNRLSHKEKTQIYNQLNDGHREAFCSYHHANTRFCGIKQTSFHVTDLFGRDYPRTHLRVLERNCRFGNKQACPGHERRQARNECRRNFNAKACQYFPINPLRAYRF